MTESPLAGVINERNRVQANAEHASKREAERKVRAAMTLLRQAHDRRALSISNGLLSYLGPALMAVDEAWNDFTYVQQGEVRTAIAFICGQVSHRLDADFRGPRQAKDAPAPESLTKAPTQDPSANDDDGL